MGRSRNNNTIKVNLAISPKTRELVEELQSRTNADSMTEVIRRAITLYDAITKAKAERSTVKVNGKEVFLI